jgi:hypothetical protein
MLHQFGRKIKARRMVSVLPNWVLFGLFWALGSLQSSWGGNQAVLPIAFLSPENGFGIGAKWIARNPLPGWNRFDIHGYATTRSQFDIKANFRHEPLRLPLLATLPNQVVVEPRFLLEGYDTPFSYYGPGNNPLQEHQLTYEPLGFQSRLETRWMWKQAERVMPWKIRMQAGVNWQNMLAVGETMSDSLRNLVLPSTTPGYAGGGFDWWELAFEYDTRNDEDLPSQGIWMGTIWGHSSPLATFDFGRGEVFAAAYLPLGAAWEVAAKASHRAVFGPAPFTEKPDLGNRKVLRGIPDQRLRDNHAESIQAEIRLGFPLALPLISRLLGKDWQLVGFAELGRVGNHLSAIQQAQWHPAAGLGGRLIIHDRLGAMRGDIGFSEYGWGLYIDFNQAF